eukprot:6214560-Pleurochrysis_carterae.AAC.3
MCTDRCTCASTQRTCAHAYERRERLVIGRRTSEWTKRPEGWEGRQRWSGGEGKRRRRLQGRQVRVPNENVGGGGPGRDAYGQRDELVAKAGSGRLGVGESRTRRA